MAKKKQRKPKPPPPDPVQAALDAVEKATGEKLSDGHSERPTDPNGKDAPSDGDS